MKPQRFHNKLGRLRVADNQRHLAFDDGTAFFYLADTAWELFHRLSREEAQHYLSNRAAKGFTVIQAVALAELGGLSIPNANSDLPLINRDPSRPNEAYFQHVDNIVQDAEALGLFIAMLPTWWPSWKLVGGNDKAIFNVDNAHSYGRFLGERYQHHALIWVLGGDHFVESDEELAIIRALAQGLKEGDGGTHLISFHPRGPGRSAENLHQETWLDFNMCQSSHGAHDHDNGIFIEQDYALEPAKPCLDAEPRYEMIPVGFYHQQASRLDRFDDYDVRQAAYWSLMAGACGHTYGHNCVWQMWAPEHEPAIWANIPWYDALDAPGAFQMGFVRQLFESYGFHELIPDQSLIADGPSHGAAKIRASRSRQYSTALIYSPMGAAFTIDRRGFKATRIKESWFDPRYGCTYHFHTGSNAAFQTYTPPSSGRGQDWLLVLEGE